MRKTKKIILSCAMGMILTGGVVSADLAFWSKGKFVVSADSEAKVAVDELSRPAHLKTPEVVKAIYLTSATPSVSRFDDLVKLVDSTELNAMVIDIKDSYGKPAYDSEVPLAQKIGISKGKIKDLPGLLKRLHEKNIYAIARIAVFQDPALSRTRPDLSLQDVGGGVWGDRKGVTWVDPAAREVWEYNAALAREVYKLGFDEINFDYIRFATDGAVSRIRYPFYDEKIPKWQVMRNFFKYIKNTVGDQGIPISVDLFGITFWRADDVNISQRLADTLPYFDFVSPMLYPSHFPAGFEGWANPSLYPYEIYKRSVERGIATAATTTGARAKIRPWIQDFDLGADYTAEMVRKEIQGSEDAGGVGWMVWNARNVYTEGAFLKE